MFTRYGVDLVLQGHDHLFSRSYPLNGEIKDDKLVTTKNEVSKVEETFNNEIYKIYDNPNGTIYLNTGTASGSKYYAALDFNAEEIPLEKVDSPSHRMFTEFIIENNTLYAKTYKIIDNEAVVFDTFGIKKTAKANNDQDDKDNNSLIIIISVASALLVGAGTIAFIIIKRKRG